VLQVRRSLEYQLAARNTSQYLDNRFALTRLYAGFEGLDGVSGKDANALLTDHGPSVVLRVISL